MTPERPADVGARSAQDTLDECLLVGRHDVVRRGARNAAAAQIGYRLSHLLDRGLLCLPSLRAHGNQTGRQRGANEPCEDQISRMAPSAADHTRPRTIQVPSSWFKFVFRLWFRVPGYRFKVRDSAEPNSATSNTEPGIMNPEHEPGTWNPEPGTAVESRYDRPRLGGGLMKRFVVLGILFTAGALSMSAAALQQAPAAGGQPAPRVVEVEKLHDNLYMMGGRRWREQRRLHHGGRRGRRRHEESWLGRAAAREDQERHRSPGDDDHQHAYAWRPRQRQRRVPGDRRGRDPREHRQEHGNDAHADRHHAGAREHRRTSSRRTADAACRSGPSRTR